MQVEYYFSDDQILKDAFLLKHVKRNKQGYVSLKLITSFRRIKSMTKDYRVTAYCLRDSTVLEVNEDGTKVKRKAPLPDYDETMPSRTILALNLPQENPTIENVAELFSHCGEISLIRVLKPGKTVPPDVKKHLMKHPELDNAVCAVVEFESHESAQLACGTMNDVTDWRKGLNVTLLSGPKKENKKNEKSTTGRQHKSSAVESKSASNVQAELRPAAVDDSALLIRSVNRADKAQPEAKHNRKDPRQKKDTVGNCESDGSWRGGGGDTHGNLTRDSLSPQSNKYSPANSPRSSPRGSPHFRRRTASHGKSPLAGSLTGGGGGKSPKDSPAASPKPLRKLSSSLEQSPSPSGSPWVQRRLKAQKEGSNSPLVGSPIGSPRLGRRMLDLEGVVRQPKGPDGPGFYSGKGRGKPVVECLLVQ